MFKTMAMTAAFALTAGLAQAQVALDMTSEYEANSLHGQGDQFFADTVNAATDEVEVTLHLSGSLGLKSADNLDAVSDGVVPIADTIGGVLAGADPIFLISSLPFVAANVEEARKLYEAARPSFDAFFAENGQILLYASPWPASGIWAKQPVDTVEKLQGLKLRTYDANGTRTLIAAGASPIQLSWADVVPQLITGGIEGVLTSAQGGVNAKFWEHLSDFTEINYAMPLNLVHMNKEVFDDLPQEAQEAIMSAAAQADARNWDAVASAVAKSYEALRPEGVTITETITPELRDHLAKAAGEVLQSWKDQTGERGAAVLSSYGEAVGRSF